MKKRQLDEAQAECASSAALTAWQTINWVSCEKEVRKLQVRIVEALKGNGKKQKAVRARSNAVHDSTQSRLFRTRDNKERTNMNTLTIDQAVYDGAALYARQNNMSVQKVIELGVKLLLTNVRHSNTKANDMELEEALKYVSTLSAKGGRTVPVDENGRDARIEKYV